MSENWIKILETIKDDKILKFIKKEFDENNIKYKIDLEERWEGNIRTPKYIGKFVVYVLDKSESEAQKILNQYYKKNDIIVEKVDKIEEIDKIEEEETEIESKKIAKKQKMAIKVYVGIVICMLISLIVVGLLT